MRSCQIGRFSRLFAAALALGLLLTVPGLSGQAFAQDMMMCTPVYTYSGLSYDVIYDPGGFRINGGPLVQTSCNNDGIIDTKCQFAIVWSIYSVDECYGEYDPDSPDDVFCCDEDMGVAFAPGCSRGGLGSDQVSGFFLARCRSNRSNGGHATTITHPVRRRDLPCHGPRQRATGHRPR